MEGEGLEEFSHLVLYDNLPDGGSPAHHGAMYGHNPGMNAQTDIELRERELALRQKELALREREYNMRRGPGRPQPPPSQMHGFEDDDDDDDYFDPMAARTGPNVDPDNIDMMSVTSRRTRKAPNANQIRKDPESNGPSARRLFSRSGPNRNATSSRLTADMPGLHDSILDNPMLGYASDRFGGFDRKTLGQNSRTNSLTTARLDELGGSSYGGYPPMLRRTSQSPGGPILGAPSPRFPGPNGHGHPVNGMNGQRHSPPSGVRQPIPRHPPGHGNAVAPQAVEQHAGVSPHPNHNLYPPTSLPSHKNGQPQVRSLTGSASASAGSGESGRLDSENSAHSSSSSLQVVGQQAASQAGPNSYGPRYPLGVR